MRRVGSRKNVKKTGNMACLASCLCLLAQPFEYLRQVAVFSCDSLKELGEHSTLERGRYFETNVGKRGFVALIDSKIALGLGKAARVLLDEAEMMGLGYSVRLKARQRVREDGDERVFQYDQRLKVGGYEAPPLTPDGRRG